MRAATTRIRALAASALALVGMCGLANTSFAQGITTGTIAGNAAAEDGSLLPGVTLEAVHVPTGTRYTGTSQDNGRFSLFNVRVGGPYRVTAKLDGFKESTVEDIYVPLGQTVELGLKMQLDTVSEVIEVTAEASPIINPDRTGTVSNVSREQIDAIPTISRSLEDIAKSSIYFNVTGGARGDDADSVSVAGRNNRYNTVLIDGAVLNDLFGLSPTGSPGGQAEAQPISLDAIQEVQLLVSPYDVRQGGFSGGGINAITKSGTNSLRGGAFFFTRDEGLVGDGPNDREFAAFSEDQFGVHLGGRIIADKLFFFVSGDIKDKETPTGFSAATIGRTAEAERFRSILQNRYGYDPGSPDEFIRATKSDNYFARLDWNIGQSNQLSMRHNKVDSENDVWNGGPTFYLFPDRPYNIRPNTGTTIAQLNGVFGSNWFNEARIGFTKVETVRDGATRFPTVQVDLPGGVSLEAGRERFSTNNELDQDILEISDDLTFNRGSHTFTVGTHNEFFSFRNLFIRDGFGFYNFRSLDDFEAGRADIYEHSFSLTGDPNQSAEFDARQLGIYAGDTWRLRDGLTLTYGLRADLLQLPDSPSFNQQVLDLYGIRTDEVPDDNLVLSPRVGFNWDPSGEGKQQLRGGVGLFSGRTPYVWISNAYGNTGNEFRRITANRTPPITSTNNIPFVPDPDGQPRSVGNAATNEVNLTDPDFEMPTVLRGNLAYDIELPWRITASTEVTYTQVEEDILYKNINIVPTGATTLGGRPVYTRVAPAFSNALLLTNTQDGESTSASLELRQNMGSFYWNAGYIYLDATEVNPGTSSQASSNWLNISSIDPNDPGTHPATYANKHRMNASLSYRMELGRVGSTFSLYFNRQSGRPYSTTYSGNSLNVNGDGVNGNDLIYVPANASEVVIQGGTWEQFDAYIEADDSLRSNRGRIVPANAGTQPYQTTLDFRWALDIPVSRVKLQLTADLLNLLNLIDEDEGVYRYAVFGEVSPVSFQGFEAGTGRPIYRLNFTNPDNRFTIDDVRSRWQAKLGMRLSF